MISSISVYHPGHSNYLTVDTQIILPCQDNDQTKYDWIVIIPESILSNKSKTDIDLKLHV